MRFSTAGSESRDWKDGERDRLQKVFEKVWESVGPEVEYEVDLTAIDFRGAEFTVDEKHRLFARPKLFTVRRKTIEEVRSFERDGFGIYVEAKARGNRTAPPHLEEHLQETVLGVGGVAKAVAVLPLTIRAEMTVETWQYAQMPSCAEASG